uniref:ribose-phosphate diphosphokinase n=1 Tax=viral metagenome TaxID=1070528 RepID=A0A6C0L1N5_9ZZZZ|tara:strand:+ start:855 stop:1868 length:1014 start_codon:yes stop_codon:yes gene_type:complete
MENVVLLSGNSNIHLASQIAEKLGIQLNENNIPSMFANTEWHPQIQDNLRGKDIFIVQSGCINKERNLSVNDIIIETLILVDACRRSAASTVNIIMPIFPYARGDKKDEPRAPISAKLIANLFVSVKIDRLVSVDLHATQIQGFIDIPFDNLYSVNLVIDCFDKSIFKGLTVEDRQNKFIVVSPDAGAVKRTLSFSEKMKLNTIIMHKQRSYVKANTIEKTILIQENETEDYEGKTAIICDDIADTCGTLISAVDALVKHKINNIICVITHGIFSKDAIQKINQCHYIKKIYVSDSSPQEENMKQCPKLEVFTLSVLLSDVIERIITRKPISELFVL